MPNFYLSFNLPNDLKNKIELTSLKILQKPPQDNYDDTFIKSRFTPVKNPHMTFLFFYNIYRKLNDRCKKVVNKLRTTSFDKFSELYQRPSNNKFTYKKISLFGRKTISHGMLRPSATISISCSATLIFVTPCKRSVSRGRNLFCVDVSFFSVPSFPTIKITTQTTMSIQRRMITGL